MESCSNACSVANPAASPLPGETPSKPGCPLEAQTSDSFVLYKKGPLLALEDNGMPLNLTQSGSPFPRGQVGEDQHSASSEGHQGRLNFMNMLMGFEPVCSNWHSSVSVANEQPVMPYHERLTKKDVSKI